MIQMSLVFLSLTMMLSGAQSTRSDPSESPQIRVMCFNIRLGVADDGTNSWPHRREMLFETIRKFDPDLLGAQEVVGFQSDELREVLDGYGFIGVGRDDGKREGEMSPIFYRTERFEDVAEGHLWLSPTPDVPGSKGWDSSLPRIASYAILRDRRDGGRTVLFVNTHWDHVGKQARLESARIIRRFIAERVRDGTAAILAGDFNCNEDSEPYAMIVRGGGEPGDGDFTLVDSYRQVHPERLPDEATFHAFKGTVAGNRIDFIFHTAQFTTTDASIDRVNDDGRYPSDHYPVTAVLRRGGER